MYALSGRYLDFDPHNLLGLVERAENPHMIESIMQQLHGDVETGDFPSDGVNRFGNRS
jgi:hypothetical protein